MIAALLLASALRLRVSPAYLSATSLNVTSEPRAAAARSGDNGLIFLRIQKTGTSTFDRIMQRQCKQRQIPCDVYWHVDWDLVTQSPAWPERGVVTWLRDPVERVASEYAYARTMQAHSQVQWDYTPEQQAQVAAADTIEKFAMLSANPANNRMVRYLLGFARPDLNCYRDCDSRWLAFRNRGGVDPGAQLLDAQSKGVTPQQLVALAQERLSRNVPFLGITDCYDPSVQVLAAQLGWPVGPMLADAQLHLRAGGRNATAKHTPSHRATLTPAAIAAVEAANALDVQVYAFGLQLVQQRMAHLTGGLCQPSLHGQ